MGQFRFDLESSIGLFTISEPVGWSTRKPMLERNTIYHGLFISYTVNLTFVNGNLLTVSEKIPVPETKAFDYLEELYNTDGVLADCTIYFYEYNNLIHDWELQTKGVIDFTTRVIVSTARGGGVEYAILDTGFKTKLKSREDTEINYNDTVGLEENILGAPTYFDCEVLGMPISDAGINSDIAANEFESQGFDEFWNIFGVDNKTEVKFYQDVIGKNYNTSYVPTSSDCFYFTKVGGSVTIDFNVNYSLKADNPGLINEWFMGLSFALLQFDSNGTYLSGLPILSFIFERTTPTDGDNYSDIKEFTLPPYSGISFVGASQGQTIVGSFIKTKLSTLINSTIVSSYIDSFPATTSKVTFPYEIFSRLKESMTGDNTPIDAEIFNRPDTSNPSIEYGKFSKYSIMNGLLIRNFLESEANLSFKFKDFYLEMERIFNVGIAVDNDILVIKDKKDFYQPNIVHTFTKDDIIVDTLEKSIDLEHFYSDVEIGYAKSAYEEISGLLEFNNKSDYSTALSKLNNKMEQVASILSGYALEFARQLQKSTVEGENSSTTDTKWDDDLMILDTVFDGGYKQRDKEGFTNVTIDGNIVVNPVMNLSITPAQNIRRHAWLLLVGLQKYAEKVIKFNKSQNVVDLETTSDTGTVRESADIKFSDLDPPIFAGTIINIDVAATLEIFKTIKADPYGLIKVWNEVEDKYNYGWIKSFGIESEDKKTNLELIEAKTVSEVLNPWLWNDGSKILWNDGKFIALNN
jgi:hypothetical protein